MLTASCDAINSIIYTDANPSQYNRLASLAGLAKIRTALDDVAGRMCHALPLPPPLPALSLRFTPRSRWLRLGCPGPGPSPAPGPAPAPAAAPAPAPAPAPPSASAPDPADCSRLSNDSRLSRPSIACSPRQRTVFATIHQNSICGR